MTTRALLLLLVIGLSGTACSGGHGPKETGDTESDTGTDTDTDTDVEPAIAITSPGDSVTIYGDVQLAYEVSGFTLDADALAAGDLTPVDGEGHVHIKVDGEYLDATAALYYDLTGLTPGAHTLTVVLAGNDHTETTTSSSVTVNVLAPTVTILSPSDSTILGATSAALALAIDGFVISPNVGGAAVVGEGHYHINVDGVYFDFGTDPARAIVPRLSPGDHVVEVELVSSDHASLAPRAADAITVTVPADVPGIEIDPEAFGHTINSSSLRFATSVSNFTLDPANVGGDNVDGFGHYHAYIDSVYTDFSGLNELWLYGLAAGDHTLEVRLAENDHTEREGGGFDYARFTIAEDRPSVTIYSPFDDEVVSEDGFFVMSTAENFTYDAASVGGTNVAGVGHYHVLIDGLYYNYDVEDTTFVSGVDVGQHTVQLELVNNDHSSFEDPVFSRPVSITVQ